MPSTRHQVGTIAQKATLHTTSTTATLQYALDVVIKTTLRTASMRLSKRRIDQSPEIGARHGAYVKKYPFKVRFKRFFSPLLRFLRLA